MSLDLSSSSVAESALNAALVSADITHSYEEYLAIIDSFYAENIEAASDEFETIVGKSQLMGLAKSWLVPLHVMAEIGGLSVTLKHQEELASDISERKYSSWILELTAPIGSRCAMTWSCIRTWKGGKVVSEYHYAIRRIGTPLGADDFGFPISGASQASVSIN